jgi:CBS domain-containing protein
MNVNTILQDKGAKVHTVRTNAKIIEAVNLLNKNNIGALVVLDENDAVVGILSERDVVRHLPDDPYAMLERPVSDCMSVGVITATRDTSIDMLMERMTKFRIRHLPIVEDGRLMGIVSIGDIVKRKIEETEQEAMALRDYIATAG